MAMTKLIAYLIPGMIFDAAYLLFCTFFVSDKTFYTPWCSNLTTALLILGIVVPCVIFYVKMPPGQNTKP